MRGCLSDGNVQAYFDIATGGVGVRAHLVGGIDQALRLVLGQARQADMQVDIQAETTGDLADADVGSDRGVIRDFAFSLAGDEFQCADEAGRIAGGEQLLRVGGLASWNERPADTKKPDSRSGFFA